MPRTARRHLPGCLYHLITRCEGRQFLLDDPAIRQRGVELLGEAAQKSGAIVLGWCFMSSHYHLAVKAGAKPLEALMKPLNSGLAGLTNRLRRRIGHVFADRFKDIIVDEEVYLLELVRYIHNNPVRAKVVGDASESTWSSHNAYLGTEEAPEWLNVGYVLSMFDEDPLAARAAFAQFVEDGKHEGRRPDLVGEKWKQEAKLMKRALGEAWQPTTPIVGSEAFVAKVMADLRDEDLHQQKLWQETKASLEAKQSVTLNKVVAAVCSVKGIRKREVLGKTKRRPAVAGRCLVAEIWVDELGRTQASLARAMKVRAQSVAKWYASAQERHDDLEEDLEKAIKLLLND